MANYSKEAERQSKAIQSILDGQEPEKRIIVGYQGDKIKLTETEKEERKVSAERADALKDARMPWFCSKCDKIMKHRLDDKVWYLYGHCFDCQIKIENKMRINGTYDKWVEKKAIANKLAWIKDQKQSIEEFKTQKAPEFLNQVRPDGYSVDRDTWKINTEVLFKQADEALEHLQKLEDSLK